jgi:hypothetical protein
LLSQGELPKYKLKRRFAVRHELDEDEEEVVGVVFCVLSIQRGRDPNCEGSLSRDKFLF